MLPLPGALEGCGLDETRDAAWSTTTATTSLCDTERKRNPDNCQTMFASNVSNLFSSREVAVCFFKLSLTHSLTTRVFLPPSKAVVNHPHASPQYSFWDSESASGSSGSIGARDFSALTKRSGVFRLFRHPAQGEQGLVVAEIWRSSRD